MDFRITSEAIASESLDIPGAGGFVSFEGKVRNQNEGRAVLRLEYEAYPELAEAEGRKVLEEAVETFGLLDARAMHRVGILEIGETALWVGVAAPHRGAAFAACQYIIDEVKKRVPVWKKEHYAEGDSTWIGLCTTPEAGATHAGDGHASEELFRRQTILKEIGEAGQEKLVGARVLVVGAGGLGCAALPYLAATGIGTIGICEGDVVDVSNLHRQVLYTHDDRGVGKAGLAAEFVRKLAPFATVTEHATRLDRGNAERIVEPYDIVVDGADNFATKFLLNEICVKLNKPLVQASLHQFEGHLMVVAPGGPCLRCLWTEQPYDGCVGTCAEAGVLGVVPGVFGVLQANEVIKLIAGYADALTDDILTLDLRGYETHRLRRIKREDCPVCGSGVDAEAIDVGFAEAALLVSHHIDIRESFEWGPADDPFWHRVPLSDPTGLTDFARTHQPCLLICEHGVRSASAARWLREQGIQAYSLEGGLAATQPDRCFPAT